MKKIRTLNADEIEVRVNQIKSNWCSVLLYKDARCDMNILDETFGAMNWEREHKELKGNIYCGVSIYDKEKDDWVTKWDAGKESYTESEKGEASDSFKRACVNIGIGRELYTSPSIFIMPRKDMTKNAGKSNEQKEYYESENGKYTTKTRFHVAFIDYDDKRNIKDLIIKDNDGHIRFSQVSKELGKEMFKLQDELEKLMLDAEKKDDNFDMEKVYEYYKSNGTNDFTLDQYKDAIELMKKKLEAM